LIAFVLALILMYISIPFFNNLTGLSNDISIWQQSWLWKTLPVLFISGIIISGLYPVLKLSSFEPITTLRGKLGSAVKGISLRKSLVIIQYLTALALITGTLIVYNQIDFMKNEKLGFDIEQILVVKAARIKQDSNAEQITTFKNILKNQNNIEKICLVTEVPGKQIYWDNGGIRKAGEDASRGKNYQIVGVDYDFADVFDVKFVAGRNFSREHPSDVDGLVFNETAVRWMGFESPETAVGQKVDYWGKIYTILGVINDYHQQSPKQVFEPHIFRFMPEGRHNLGVFAVKIKTNDTRQILDQVENTYAEFFPGNPFDYFFLDEYFDRQYKSDVLFGKVFGIFAVLALFVTSLGILGLVAFMVTQRTKEIGIRKVLGADIRQILQLLTMEIVKLILISFIILVPLVYWGAESWLQSFATRMEYGIGLFFIPLALTLLITILVMGTHVVKAALMNPVHSLKYE